MSLSDRHPVLTVTPLGSIVDSKPAVTIVTQLVWIYAFPHIDSPSICEGSDGMAEKGTQCAHSGAALGKRQLLWPTVPATVLLWDHWAMGSPEGDRPWLSERMVTGGMWRRWAHWTDKPRGLLSDCTLLRLPHGQNGKRFNLTNF